MSYLGFKHSKETIKKMSIAHRGIKNVFFGKKHSKKANEKNSIAHLGKKMSEEHRRKTREAGLGRKHSEESKRKISIAHKGKIISEKTRKKMSEAKVNYVPWNKGKKLPELSGKNSNHWKGGITPIHNQIRGSLEYKQWQKNVFIRDNYFDQKSKIRGGNLVAHHILNFAQYPQLRFEVNNGITLSREAHDEFHKMYGKRNNTKEQLKEFLCQ
ncbi:MAG TPA: hypothetical protein ENH99_01460 [Candidatus Pacearchaeota archaeon]|nr:hypothetical protein [Candidatus Pacearchaeota archaeon]